MDQPNSGADSAGSDLRFEVALSFASENKRDKVRQIAELLREKLGDGKVFFDEWFEAEAAGVDGSTYFQNIYGKQSQLVVTCVCGHYNQSQWTQDEWAAIRAFERELRDVSTGNIKRMRFLPLRFGDGKVDGLFSTAIVPDVRDRMPEAIAALILERLRLSKRGSVGLELTSPAVPGLDPELSAIAEQPYEPPDERGDWYQASRDRLRELVEEILDESAVTRRFILQCNVLSERMTAKDLAVKIFESTLPMSILRKCVRQQAKKRKLTSEEQLELAANIFRLVNIVAPICFTIDDLRVLEPYVSRSKGDYAVVSTREKMVAVCMVAGIKGVAADLNAYTNANEYNLDGLQDLREIVLHLPPPPEPGRRPSNLENPINAVLEVLSKAIDPVPQTLEHVQARVAHLAEFDEIFFVLMFDKYPGDSYLRILHKSFPQLVLLVPGQFNRSNEGRPGQDISLADQIRELRAEFGPKSSGNAT